MTYRDWHVGMEVVYVGWEYTGGIDTSPLVLKKIYVIRDLSMAEPGHLLEFAPSQFVTSWFQALYIGLADVPGWWLATGFRPLAKRKTDISIFTAMLTGAKEREPA